MKKIRFIACILTLIFSIQLVTVYTASAEAADIIAKHKNNLNDLGAQLEGCASEGISTDYETLYYNVIEKFIGYMEEEAITLGDTSNLEYYDSELEKLYDLCITNINDYKTGIKTPMSVPKYKTGDISAEGKSFFADMEVDGRLENRPVFLYGYGHFDHVKAEIDKMPDFGANFVQINPNLANLLVEQSPAKGWYVRHQNDVSGSVTIDSSNKYAGNNSIKLTRSGEYKQNDLVCIYQDIYVKPNTKYNFGMRVKANGANKCWFGFGPTKTVNRISLDGSYSDWEFYSNSYTTGENDNENNSNLIAMYPDENLFHLEEEGIRLRFAVYTEGNTSSINIDDCFVREAGSKVNLLQNGGFEDGAPEDAQNGFMFNEIVLNSTLDVLQRAQDNNVVVDLNLSLHELGEHIVYSYKKEVPTEGITWSLGYDILNPGSERKIERAYEYYIRNFIKKIKDYSCVKSICLTNEMQYHSNKSTAAQAYFEDYLKDRYQNDIDALNLVYKTSYNNFSEVKMPTGNYPEAAVGGLMLFEDWRQFNDDVFTGFHKWISDIIKEEAGNLLLHTKMCANTFKSDQNYRNYLTYGANPEKLAGVLDLNGNDAGNKIENQDIVKTMMFYDLQTSIKNAPIVNSENHFINDGDSEKNLKDADNLDANLWQGAISGLGATAVWMWDRAEGIMPEENSFASLVLNRPDVAAKAGKAFYDVNRLSYEIKALCDEVKRVGILYSDHSRSYQKAYMNVCYSVYEQLLYSGIKPGFITDSMTEIPSGYDYVIIPFATNVPQRTIDALKSFAEDGGNIIILGDASLSADTQNKAHSIADVQAIYDKAQVIPISVSGYKMTSPADLKASLSEKLGNLPVVKLKNPQTGEDIDKVAYQSAVYNGNLLINICSYDYANVQSVPADVYIYGKKANSFTELRSGEEVSAVSVELLKPMLLSVPLEDFYTEADAEAQEAEIKNGWKRLSVSWKNPALNTLTGAALYNSSGTLISDEFSALPGDENIYTTDKVLTDGEVYGYKLVFSFSDRADKVVYLSGKPGQDTQSVFSGWTKSYDGGNSNLARVEISADSSEKFAGNYSMHITADKNTTWMKLAADAGAKLEAGKTYRMSLYRKAENANNMYFYADNPTSYPGKILRVANTNSTTGGWWWEHVFFTAESPTTMGTAVLTIDAGSTEDLWIDNLIIREVTAGSNSQSCEFLSDNLVVNGDFETLTDANAPTAELTVEPKDGAVRLLWSCSDNTKRVRIYERLADGTLAIRANMCEKSGRIEIPNLENGKRYTYVIKAENASLLTAEQEAAAVPSAEPIIVSGFEFYKDGVKQSVLEPGKLEAEIQLTNNSENKAFGTAFLALYKNDELILAAMQEKTVSADSSERLEPSITVPDDGGEYTAKAFLWDNSMKPYSFRTIY